MPWPEPPLPRSVDINPPLRNQVEFGTDQGYSSRRAISTRHLRQVTLTYTLGMHNTNILMSYMINDLNDGINVIDGWTMPLTSSSGHDGNASRVLSTVAGLITFEHPQSYVAGDWLSLSGAAQALRIQSVTSATVFQLEVATINTGLRTARLHFPKAAVVLNDGRVPQPQKIIGPMRDDKGLFESIITLQERL